MRAGRDANGPGGAHLVIDRAQHQIAVEDLDSPVAPVGNIDVALGVGCDGVRRVELIGLISAGSNRLNESPVLVVLDHSRIAVAVGDVDISSGVPSDIGGPVEDVRPGWRRGSSRWL